MKKLLLVTSALLAAGQAGAADLAASMPVKAPIAAPVVPYSWTGCHVGAHIGAGWDRTSMLDPGTLAVPSFLTTPSVQTNIAPVGSAVGINGEGFLGGFQAGCDYQFASHWVVGLAGDFTWTDIKGFSTDPFFAGKNGGPIALTTRTEWIATATGRLGYAWDRFLVYGKGGAAWARDSYSLNNLTSVNGGVCFNNGFISCNPTGAATRFGWTAGGGLEWAFADNWSAFAEYDHYGFDRKTVGFVDPNSGTTVPALLNVKQDIDAVKVGINYRFWPGGVVARY